MATAAPLLDGLQASVEQTAREAGAGQGVAQGAGSLVSAAVATALGAVAGGGSVAGAATALGVDANNRQLHPTEKDRIKKLAGGDAEKEARLMAAACAKVKCYAEFPENSATYQQLKQLADIGASDAFAAERQLLSEQSGMFGYGMNGALSDANVDAMRQFNNTYQVGVRALGAGQAVIGSAGVAGSLVTAPVSCATGVGCAANASVGVISLDAAYAGARQLVSGDPESTYLNQGLQSLGMSPEAAAWTEASLGIGAAAKAGAVASKVIDDAIALDKLSVASYQNFATKGMNVTAEVMETPQAQALVKEIQAGSPGMSVNDATRYAIGYIESGTSLPQTGIAAQGSTLIKVVPKGGDVSPISGYWMTPKQAQAIAMMTPEQVGKALGLPAAQAANILQSGVEFLAITPRPGVMPRVFVSNVASTSQGAATMPGGAQQVIVPNRLLWTEPVPINPFSLMQKGVR